MSRRQNIVSEISSDFLTCHICLETYNRPKNLPCGHFFCRDCLLDYCSHSPTNAATDSASGKDIYCPTCRVKCGCIPLQNDITRFVDRLADNFYVNSLKDLVHEHARKRSVRSKSDKGEDLESKNTEERSGLRSRSTSEPFHKVHLKDQPVFKSGIPCRVHPEMMIEFYCTTHNDVLCTKCKLINYHKSCESILIPDAENKNIRPRAKEAIAFLNSRKESVLSNIRKLTLGRQQVHADLCSIEKHIDDKRVHLESIIDEHFNSVKEALRAASTQCNRSGQEKLESAKTKENILQEMICDLESVYKTGDVFELASSVSKVDLSTSESSEEVKLSTVKLTSNDRIWEAFLSKCDNIFGDIVHEDILTEPVSPSEQGAAAASSVNNVEGTAALPESDFDSNDATDQKVDTNKDKDYQVFGGVFIEPQEQLKLKVQFTIDNSADMCCSLRNGDIAVVSSIKRVLAVYGSSGTIRRSLEIPTSPLGITACKSPLQNLNVALTGIGCFLYFVVTEPYMKLAYKLSTRAQYSAIARIPKYLSLLALAVNERDPFLDVVSLKGQVLRTIPTTNCEPSLFVAPIRIASSAEYIYIIDKDSITITSWDLKVIEKVSAFGDLHLDNLSSICIHRPTNTCYLMSSYPGWIFSLARDQNKWTLKTALEFFDTILEPCDLSAGVSGLVLISGGRSVSVFDVPGVTTQTILRKPRSIDAKFTTLADKYQTQ